jgi:hypothetical protein
VVTEQAAMAQDLVQLLPLELTVARQAGMTVIIVIVLAVVVFLVVMAGKSKLSIPSF